MLTHTATSVVCQGSADVEPQRPWRYEQQHDEGLVSYSCSCIARGIVVFVQARRRRLAQEYQGIQQVCVFTFLIQMRLRSMVEYKHTTCFKRSAA